MYLYLNHIRVSSLLEPYRGLTVATHGLLPSPANSPTLTERGLLRLQKLWNLANFSLVQEQQHIVFIH